MRIALLLQVASALSARPDTVKPVHDALHYDITLVIGDTSRHILGEVETRWRLGSTDPVQVALDSSLRVIRVGLGGQVERRGARPRWARPPGLIVVPHDKRAGDTLVTRIRYRGLVQDGLVIRDSAGRRTIFADNWPDRAHRWFPSQDHPSDKATVSWHVEVPAAYRVIANGRLEKIDTLPRGSVRGRRAVWHYRMEQPVPVYTMVIGAASWLAVTPAGRGGCAVTCIPVSVWTYPEDSAYAVTGPFRRAAEMIDYFTGLVGEFPYPSLAHVQSSTIFGGMENSTAIFYDERAYQRRNLSENTVAHETAHQWFGDAVTEADWHHLWLSEGFATYFASLWGRHTQGDSLFRAAMQADAQTIFKSPVTERPIVDTAATDLMALLNTNNYPKGGWVLHQLRGLIGDSAFFTGMRRYYERYRNGTALSADFARVMSEAAGGELGWYFEQALLQPGYPVLDVRWRWEAGALAVDVEQTQKPEWGTYRLPGLELAVDGRVARIDVAANRTTRATVPGVAQRPSSVVVDPNGWWLMQAKVSGAP